MQSNNNCWLLQLYAGLANLEAYSVCCCPSNRVQRCIVNSRIAFSYVATAGTVRVQRNENFGKLRAGYLFPEVRYLQAILSKCTAANHLRCMRLH